MAAQGGHFKALVQADPWQLMAAHRHKQVGFVQHLVVLEVVQQCAGHRAWLCAQEDRCAFNPSRWAQKYRFQKTLQVNRVGLQLFLEDVTAFLPGHHQGKNQACNQNGKPAALNKLQCIRCQKRKVNDKENARSGDAQTKRVLPAVANHVKSQNGGDQHVAAHSDAISRGQRVG